MAPNGSQHLSVLEPYFVRYLLVSLMSVLLVTGCTDTSSLSYRGEDNQSAMDSCSSSRGSAFATWQCEKFHARQQINGACLKAPGGDLSVWQCQQYYKRIAERPPPPSMSSPSPAPAPEEGTD